MHTNTSANDNDGSLATAQMSMKKGLKMFGKGGVKAVHGKMQQLPRANQEKGVAWTDGSAHSQVLQEFTTRSPVEKTNKLMTHNDQI